MIGSKCLSLTTRGGVLVKRGCRKARALDIRVSRRSCFRPAQSNWYEKESVLDENRHGQTVARPKKVVRAREYYFWQANSSEWCGSIIRCHYTDHNRAGALTHEIERTREGKDRQRERTFAQHASRQSVHLPSLHIDLARSTDGLSVRLSFCIPAGRLRAAKRKVTSCGELSVPGEHLTRP